MNNPEFDVFLSHSSVDKPWVTQLKTDLTRYNLRVWLDKDEIRPGSLFAKDLEQALENCRAIVLIVSPEALASGWVEEEYYRALSLTKNKGKSMQLIPVLYKQAELPGFLANRSWIDFQDETNYDQRISELVWGITGQKPPEALRLKQGAIFIPPSHLFIEVSIFHSESRDQYLARFNSSIGNEAVPFVLPNMTNLDHELDELRQGIGRSLRRDSFRSTEDLDRPKVFGERLFKGLFSGKALELYQACRRELDTSTQVNQRLVIKINPTTYTLAKLPWELLYDAKANGYLAFDRRTPIIRFIPDRPLRHKSFDLEWRILLVASNPPNTAPLDLLGEIKNIKKAFEDIAPFVNLKIKDLLSPSPRAFREALRDFDPHIFHFIGHGGGSRLLLEDGENGRTMIGEANLASTLQNIPSLRLAFLNACESAAAESEQNLGLAYALSQASIPAVVANQFPARDDAAQEMSNEFYRVLAAGRPIDEATLWGRISLQGFRSLIRPTLEWATPVLYLQTPDGYLFNDLLQRQRSATPKSAQQEVSFQPEKQAEAATRIYGERIEALQEQLTIRYRNLNRLQEQAASWGSLNAPIHIFNQIDKEQEEIEQIQEELNSFLQQTQTESTAPLAKEIQEQRGDQPAPPDLAILYAEAQQSLDYEQWNRAVSLLQQIIEIDVSYKDTSKLHQIALHYKQGQTAFQERDWAKSIEHFGQIQSLSQDFHDVSKKSTESQQQLRWDNLYAEGLAYLERKDWDNAVEALQQVEPDDNRRRNLKRDLNYAQARQVYAYAIKQAKTAEDRLSDWEKVVGLLEPIITTSATYPEVASVLQEARQQVTWLKLYYEGQSYYQAENWLEAIRVFDSINREKSDYRDVSQLLEKAHKQQRLAEHYTRGCAYFEARNWRAARDEFQAIQKIDQSYPKVTTYLALIEREIRLADLYDQAQQDYQNDKWDDAIAKLEQIVTEAEDYDEGKAVSRLENWKKVNEARKLYQQGMAFVNNYEWAAAIQCFEQLRRIDPNGYADAAVELEKARLELKLEELYRQADQLIQDSQWENAITTLREIKTLRADYREVDTLFVEAEASFVQALYNDACRYQANRDWDEAIRLLETIQQRKPDYQDVVERLAEVQRQKQLVDWYAKAYQSFAAENWLAAIELFQKIEELQPEGYEDSKKHRDQAEHNQHMQELYTQAKNASEQSDLEKAEQIFQKIDPGYRDVQKQLAQIHQNKQLITLYNQAQRAFTIKNWDEAIELYAKILEIKSDYQDVQERLREVNEFKHLADLHYAAEQAIAKKNWQQALDLLRKMQALRRDDPDVKAELEEVEKLSQIHILHQTAIQLETQNDLVGALGRYRLILRLDPNRRDIMDKVAEITESLELEDLYQRALIALDKLSYADAIPLLQSIVEKADYKDAAQQLEQATREANLSALYQRGSSAFQSNDWAKAVEYFEKIQAIDTRYRDVSTKLAYARQQLNWDLQYSAGLTYIQEGNWDRAVDTLVQVEPDDGRRWNQPRELAYAQAMQAYTRAEQQASLWSDYPADWEQVIRLLQPIYDHNPGYRDVARLLHEVGRWENLAKLYDDAKQYVSANNWLATIKVYEAILSEQPDYRDSVHQLQNASIQQKLANHYQKALQDITQQRWFDAQDELGAILELDSAYRDAPDLLTQVERELQLAQLYKQATEAYQNDNLEAAIINLARVTAKAPNYHNDEAKLLLHRWEKQNDVQKTYQQGIAAMDKQEWNIAIEAFDHLFDIEPSGFLDVRIRLEEARLEQRLKELYSKANHLLQGQHWGEAITCLKEIQTQREKYEDVSGLLIQAEEERWFETQYLQARQYQGTQDWDRAITILEGIRRRRPDYADTEDRLKEIKDQKQLTDWYAEANRALAAQDWDKAISLLQNIINSGERIFENIEGLYQQAERNRELTKLYNQAITALNESDFDKAENLLVNASALDSGYLDVKIKLAEVQRKRRLMKLYDAAQAAFIVETWDEAINAYRQVVDIDPKYENAAEQLRKVEELQKMAARKLTQINELRQSADQCQGRGDLVGALERYKAILNLDPGLEDVIAKVEELKDAVELAQFYQDAMAALKALRFTEGIPLLMQLVEKRSDYKDAKACLEKAIGDHYTALLDKYHLAKNLENRKRYKEAKEHFQAYQEEKNKSTWLSTD